MSQFHFPFLHQLHHLKRSLLALLYSLVTPFLSLLFLFLLFYNAFIQEFALTFDGNKWGHNGPYLVSRVLSRVSGRSGFNVTVMPPSAFYPVDWRGIRSLFEKPRDEKHSKWLVKKLGEIHEESLALHLWNRQSRKLEVAKGSIVDSIISNCCIFCNSWN